MVLYVDIGNKMLVKSDGLNRLAAPDHPQVFEGSQEVFEITFFKNGAVYPINSNDTFAATLDNNFVHTDDIMASSSTFTIVNASAGRVNISMLFTAASFTAKLAGAAKITAYLDIKRYLSGETVPETLLQDTVSARASIVASEGSPETGNPEYYTSVQVDSLLGGYALLSGADFTGSVSVVGTMTLSGLTASTVPYLDASKVLTSSAVTPTELGYLSGVTSAIQTQLDGKVGTSVAINGNALTGNITLDADDLADGTTNAMITLTQETNFEAAYTHSQTTSGNPHGVTASETGAIEAPASPAQGDILFYNGSAWTNLTAGTSGQFFQTQGAGANPKWATVTGGSGSGDVTGPVSSTDGHIAVFDGTTGKTIKDSNVAVSGLATSGANSNITSLTGLTTALSVAQGGTGLSSLGTAGQVLTVNSGATGFEFTTPSGGGMTNPMTTAGDLIIGGTSGTPARLAAGTSGYVLTGQGTATAPIWSAPAIDLSSYGSSHDGHYTRFSYSSSGIDEHTVACLHFDDSVTDAAGHWGTASVTGSSNYVTGKFSKAFHFDAASGYGPVIYPYNASYFDFNDNQKVTFEFWIKTTDNSSISDGKFVFSHAGDGGTKDTRFYVYFSSGSLVFRTARNDASPSLKEVNIGSVADGNWHHCAITYNGAGTIKTWLDGTLSATESYYMMSSGQYGSDGFSFGDNHFGTPGVGGVFDLDEVRMTIGKDRYTDTFTPPVAPFSASVTRALYVDSLTPPYIAAPTSPTQGDILYYSGSAWAKLAAGTSGQYLQTQGASANPQWATVTGTGGLLKASGSGYALDNGSAGRGTVGTKAVSLEYSDAGSGYGATGNYSFSCGILNKASGTYSISAGGIGNTASGLESSVFGGLENTASGDYSTVFGGVQNTSIGKYSISGGYRAKTANFSEFSFASGKFSENGDCQRGSIQARIATSSTDAAILYLDGSSEKFTLSSGDHYSCRIHLIGAQADGSTGDYYALVKIKNVSGTTSLSGTVRVLEAWEGDTNLGTPTISITADDTNDALQIAVTPANATATRWTAVVEYVKINY